MSKRPTLECVHGRPFTSADVEDPAAVVLIVGLRGTGKTTVAWRELVDSTLIERLVIFDPHGEYDAETITIDEFEEWASTDLQELPEDAAFIAAVRPADLEDPDIIAEQTWKFVRACKKYVRNALILVDEAGLVEICKRAGHAFNYLATQSRHFGSAGSPLVFLSQRAGQVPPTVRSQSTIIVSFAQSSLDDIEKLEERFEVQEPDLGGKIATLGQSEYVVWRLWEKRHG